jgi:hypothetical protein
MKGYRVWLAITGGATGGATAVVFAGPVRLLGAGVFLLAVLVLGSSPPAVAAYRRWMRSASTRSGSQLDALAQAFAYASPGYVPIVPPAELADLSDKELCQAWRTSYLAVQQQASVQDKTAIVTKRQKYLDEFERRNPSGFAAWLATDGRVPANLLPYLVGQRHGRPSINWDELTRGQDR